MWKDELKALFREYVSRKQRQNILDYDDLLLYLYYLLQDQEIADYVSDRFDHALVDEYQDTNRIQAGILIGLRRRNHNIMVVGDDAQSIYRFRSATIRNMLDFPQQFPGTKIITLEQNYRSIQPILSTTNRVIAQARELPQGGGRHEERSVVISLQRASCPFCGHDITRFRRCAYCGQDFVWANVPLEPGKLM